MTREETERLERYVRTYDARHLAGMLIEIERDAERTRKRYAKRIAAQEEALVAADRMREGYEAYEVVDYDTARAATRTA